MHIVACNQGLPESRDLEVRKMPFGYLTQIMGKYVVIQAGIYFMEALFIKNVRTVNV